MMTNISVGRYDQEQRDGNPGLNLLGWIAAEDKSFVALIDLEGRPTFYLDTCELCGGLRVDKHPEGATFFCPHRDPETHELRDLAMFNDTPWPGSKFGKS